MSVVGDGVVYWVEYGGTDGSDGYRTNAIRII